MINITKQTPIAVVGVSTNPEKYGHKVFRDFLSAGYNVIGINPKGGNMLGQNIYMSFNDLPFIPEVVVTVVRPESTEEVVEQIKDKGIKLLWMQPGSESEDAITRAREYGMEVISNACIMKTNGIWK